MLLTLVLSGLGLSSAFTSFLMAPRLESVPDFFFLGFHQGAFPLPFHVGQWPTVAWQAMTLLGLSSQEPRVLLADLQL